ncbi:MAG: site-specific DNA-methyltransferase [Ignavibacteria bacterium]|nr:site-specific DNA-methyltransferase [Ignavibacteria bacterium]
MLINHIYVKDCIEALENDIDNDSIHLIYADPPYNISGYGINLLKNKTGGAYYKINETWDTWLPDDYTIFTAKWMFLSQKVLRDNGSLYISCTQHNIGEIINIAKKLNLKLNNIITWYKTNSMPNITKRTFTHATEFVCWFVKGKNWIFNYEDVKKFNPHKTKEGKDKQLRDFLDFIEIPILQGKERLKGLSGRAAHPTQKPEKLIELIVLASSNKDEVVLDPFFGTGTTGFVAQKMQRNWIGIENNVEYAKLAKKRLFKNE